MMRASHCNSPNSSVRAVLSECSGMGHASWLQDLVVNSEKCACCLGVVCV